MQNNIPEFLYDLLNNQYGQNITTQIVNGYNSTRPITLRVNTLKSNTDYIKDILNRNNINYHDVSWYSDALILNNVSILQIKQLDIYKNGEIYLQSLSSMIPPLILSPQKDENILDMAAAPGGKTTQMLALSDNKAYITATEKNKIRAERLKYNITKQNANRINVMVSDARNLDNFFSFDKILLDAPCSGSGTLNINDEKQLSSFTEDLINRSSKFQSSLLEKAITLLKHNHEIVYSTCSILKAENENILQKFISKNKIEIVPIDYSTFSDIPLLPTSINGTLCISPSDLYEGFFVAKLRKL
ncbi:MAG: RsmB/NOP family class I SAM-dependent RNA methyltransferase [Clostridia bacterium]